MSTTYRVKASGVTTSEEFTIASMGDLTKATCLNCGIGNGTNLYLYEGRTGYRAVICRKCGHHHFDTACDLEPFYAAKPQTEIGGIVRGLSDMAQQVADSIIQKT